MSETKEIVSDKVCRVVCAADLESLTRNGWKLLRVLNSTSAKPAFNQVSHPSNTPGGYPMSTSETIHFLAAEPLFLLEEDVGSTRERAAADLARLNTLVHNAENAAVAAVTAQKDAVKKVDDLEYELKRINVVNIENYKNWKESEPMLRKVKEDMAKLRIAFGDLKVKEILDGK